MVDSQNQRRPRIRGVLVSLLANVSLLLTACSPGLDTAVFTQESSGRTTVLTYYAVGDEVVRQQTVNTVEYEAAGIPDQAALEGLLDGMAEQFDGLKGLEYSVEYGEKHATERLSVDYRVANIRELAKLTGSEFTGTDEPVSLEMSRKMLLDQGYAETN